MWQAFPYNHGKLKLFKDLKTAKANLRSSLIEKEEISNMDQVSHQLFRFLGNEKITIILTNRHKPLPQLVRNPSKKRLQLI